VGARARGCSTRGWRGWRAAWYVRSGMVSDRGCTS
jgi:hypothetical protein